jgi:hypothetical protein
MTIPHIVLLSALCLQFYNVGTIWLVQRVVYPLFAQVGAADYIPYHTFYLQRIPLPVIVPGFLCMFVPIAVLIWLPDSVSVWLAWTNLACGAVTFLVTVGLEIPRHGLLKNGGKNDQIIADLITFNWPRTVSITGSAILTVAMAGQAFAVA